jgi:hypothetical protein
MTIANPHSRFNLMWLPRDREARGAFVGWTVCRRSISWDGRGIHWRRSIEAGLAIIRFAAFNSKILDFKNGMA